MVKPILFLLQPSPSPVVVFVAGAVAAREVCASVTSGQLRGFLGDVMRLQDGMGWMRWDGWDGMGWDGLMSSIVYSFVKLPII